MNLPHAPRTGRVLSGLCILFLTFDGVFKLLAPEPVRTSMTTLGFRPELAFGLGVLQLLCVLAYAVPATALRGAVLLTGYLGGAIVTHLRVGDPWLSHTLFPLYVAALLWAGLALRSPTACAFVLGRPPCPQ